MSKPNYRQGFMAGLIVVVFFAGDFIGAGHGAIAVVGAAVVVAVAVAFALLILRSGTHS